METIAKRKIKAREAVIEAERRLRNLHRIAEEESRDLEGAETALRASRNTCKTLEEKLENRLLKESVQDAFTSLFNANPGEKQEVGVDTTTTKFKEKEMKVIVIESFDVLN